jgi:hypothetical protein
MRACDEQFNLGRRWSCCALALLLDAQAQGGYTALSIGGEREEGCCVRKAKRERCADRCEAAAGR